MQTKYITLDEYNEYYPSDEIILALGETEAKAELKREEDFIELFVNSQFNRNIENEYPDFSETQQAHYKLAIIEQVHYVFRSSDISSDSGYDPDKGVVSKDLKGKMIAPKCKMHLEVCGIWNRNLQGRTGFFSGWFLP